MPHSFLKQALYFIILGLVRVAEFFYQPFKQRKTILVASCIPLMVERSIFLARHLQKNNKLKVVYCLTNLPEFSAEEIDRLEQEFQVMSYQKSRFLHWDVILFPAHTKRFRDDVKKIYIDHGVTVNKRDPSGRMLMVGEQPWDENGNYVYDQVFVESEYHKDIISRAYDYMKEKLVVVGCLYSQSITSTTKDKSQLLADHRLSINKETIVILSTWGNSLLDLHGKKLLSLLPQLCEKYNVVFSVHPISANTHSQLYNPICEKFESFAQENDSFCFFSEAQWVEFLPHADIVVSDHTSACCYSLPYVKGMVFVAVDTLESVWHECAIRELSTLASAVTELDSLLDVIENECAKNKKSQYEALAKKVFGDYTNTVENYLEQLCP